MDNKVKVIVINAVQETAEEIITSVLDELDGQPQEIPKLNEKTGNQKKASRLIKCCFKPQPVS